MSLPAGSFDNRITIQRPFPSEDAAGQPLASWDDHAKLWADIRLVGGLAAIKASADVSIIRASIRIRQRSDITAGMRAVHTARGVTTVYDIEAVPPPVAGQDYTDLICKVVR